MASSEFGDKLDRFSQRILERAGIHSSYQVCKLGPEEVYVRVLKAQGSARLGFYYNLVSRLTDVSVEEIGGVSPNPRFFCHP